MRLMSGTRQSPEVKFLLSSLAGEKPALPQNLNGETDRLDWLKLTTLSLEQGVAPWMLSALSANGMSGHAPQEAMETLGAFSRASALEALSLGRALAEAMDAFDADGVPAIVLKGPAVAERFYPDAALRPYGDLDILVPLEAHDSVSATLERLGYEVREDHGGLHSAFADTCESPFEIKYVHPETRLRLEIHYDHLQTGLRPTVLDGVWERSEPWGFLGTGARTLSLNDLFLLLCVHLNKHGFGRLIWFKDIDLILRLEGHRLDWEWLEQIALDEGAAGSLGYTLRLLPKLLGTPLTPEAEAFARAHGSPLFHRFLWPESSIMELSPRRWRRAVQFVPSDGLRGAIPAFLVMGRRGDKAKALYRRLTRSR